MVTSALDPGSWKIYREGMRWGRVFKVVGKSYVKAWFIANSLFDRSLISKQWWNIISGPYWSFFAHLVCFCPPSLAKLFQSLEVPSSYHRHGFFQEVFLIHFLPTLFTLLFYISIMFRYIIFTAFLFNLFLLSFKCSLLLHLSLSSSNFSKWGTISSTTTASLTQESS